MNFGNVWPATETGKGPTSITSKHIYIKFI